MSNIATVMVHQLQLDVLHKINQLNQPLQGILEMEIHLALGILLMAGTHLLMISL
jgi:hypothetical protein